MRFVEHHIIETTVRGSERLRSTHISREIAEAMVARYQKRAPQSRFVVEMSMTTSQLWDAAHGALCAGKWSEARALLDDLGLRNDNRDLLSSAKAYRVPEMVRSIIQDRIDLVNAKAMV